MNPKERSLPEFISDDSEGNSSSQHELGPMRPADPVPQTSRDSSQSLTAAELRRTGNSDQQHRLASRRKPDPGLIPSSLASPLNLIGLPPCSWVQSGSTLIMCSPIAPQTSQRPTRSSVSHAPSSRPPPCTLVPSSSPQVFCSMVLLPPFIQPVGWCLTQVQIQQTLNPALIQNRTEIKLLNETVTPPSVLDKSPAGTRDEQQKTSDETEALKNLKKFLKVPPGPSSSWEKNLKFEPCEDCMVALKSVCSEVANFCAQVTEEKGEDQRDESETAEEASCLEYLDDLCHKDSVQTLESSLDPDFLNSILSSDPEDLGLSAQKQQEQETSSDPPPVTVTTSPTPSPPDLTSSYLNSDPLSMKSEPNSHLNRQDSHKESQENLCRPLVESRLLEEEADSLLDVYPSCEKNMIPIKTRSTVCLYCRFFLDNTFTLPDDTTLTKSGPASTTHKWTPATPRMEASPSDGSSFKIRTKATNVRRGHDKNLEWLKKGSRVQKTSTTEKITPVRQSLRLLEKIKKAEEKLEMVEHIGKLGENGQIKSQLFKEESKKEEITPSKASAASGNENGPETRVKTGKPMYLLRKLAPSMKSQTSGVARTDYKSPAAERAEDQTKTQITQKAGKRKLGTKTQQLVSRPVKKRRTKDQHEGPKEVKVRQKAPQKRLVKKKVSKKPLKKRGGTTTLPKRPKTTPKAAPETPQWSVENTGEMKMTIRNSKGAQTEAGSEQTKDVEGPSRPVGPVNKLQNRRGAPKHKQGSKTETGKAKVQPRAANQPKKQKKP